MGQIKVRSKVCQNLHLLTVLFALAAPPAAQAHCPTFSGGIGIAGPINTFPASTLPEGKSAAGIRAEVTQYHRLSTAELETAAMEGRTAHSMAQQQIYSLGAAYGITDNLTVGMSIPYVVRRGIEAVHYDNETQMSMLHDIGTSNGLGDLTLFGQYRLVHDVYQGLDLSLLAGIKAPTGTTDNRSGGATVETEHQPGSGSWDPLGGAAVSRRFERLSLHAAGLYTVATNGSRSTTLGDRAQVALATAYRLGGKSNYGDCDEVYEYFYPESRAHWLGDLVLELNGNWQGKARVAGARDDSSGGTTLYLSPGVRVTYDGRYSGYFSVGVPVYQELNGSQSKVEYRVAAGAAVAF